MKKKRMLIRSTVRSLALGLACAFSAFAQDYPNRAVRVVIPYAAGGSTDILTRILAQRMTARLGQGVVVENRPGANGIIGTDAVAKSPADGYTLLMVTNGQTISMGLYPKLPWDVEKDFAPIVNVAAMPNTIVVHPSQPFNSLKDLIDYARAKPGSLSYSHAGIGSPQHLAGELFKLVSKVNIVQVPYKGTAGQLTALLGNEVQMTFSTMPPAMPLVQAGRLRAIAIGSPRRSPALPDVPTVAESGYPGFDIGAWNGILAPAGTPAAIVNRLATEIARVAKNPEAREKASSQGAELISMTPQEFTDYIKKMTAHFAKVVKATGMRPD